MPHKSVNHPGVGRVKREAGGACGTAGPFGGRRNDAARSRLTRLARIWTARLEVLSTEQLDHSPGAGWTLRQVAFHLGGSVYYADAVGDLSLRR
ncbi:hypothetical protein [Microbispora rosea]|uniref:hypothetical protein n=1 Tax=Microbispora rosea TaxID=58117 RepID=UPI00342B8ED6